MRKKVLTLLLFFIIIFGISALFIFKVEYQKELPKTNKEEPPKISKPYGYDMLNEFEKQLYDYMETRKLKFNEIYYFKEKQDYYSILKVDHLYRAHNYYLCNDYCYVPEQQDIPGMHEKELPAIGIRSTRVLFPDEQWKDKKEAAENKAKEVVTTMPKNLTKLEQIQYLYDYVINNVEYEDIAENDISSSYSGLILKKAVCEGYARTFEELAKAAGFNVLTVYGEVFTYYQGHAWNMIEYNGNWYHLDATWDDNNVDFYSYFMLSDKEHKEVRISRNIHFTDEISVPKADHSLSKEERDSIKRK